MRWQQIIWAQYNNILLFAFPIEAFPCSGTNKGPIVKGPRAGLRSVNNEVANPVSWGQKFQGGVFPADWNSDIWFELTDCDDNMCEAISVHTELELKKQNTLVFGANWQYR